MKMMMIKMLNNMTLFRVQPRFASADTDNEGGGGGRGEDVIRLSGLNVLMPDGVPFGYRTDPPTEPSTREEEEEEEEEESPEPTTSHAHASNLNTKVCKIMVEEAVSHIITNEWRTTSQTLDEVTTNICESITALCSCVRPFY